MDNSTNNWRLGELISVKNTYTTVKEGRTSYGRIAGSRHICIREATDGQRGMLLKVLGKTPRHHIKVIAGEPFCKDDKYEGFGNDTYYTYRFPTTDELKEALAILRGNADLLAKFDAASMYINPNSTFWVRETVSHMFFGKKLQYYDSKSDTVAPSSSKSDDAYYRITIAYF
jgi:hypothetical protein